MPSRAAPRPSPQDAMSGLAAALRARRRALALTQVELGRYADCGPDFVYDLESGKPTMRLDKLLSVLGVLGLSLRLTEGRPALAVDEPLRARAEEPLP